MAYTKSDRGDAPMRRRGMGRRRKKVCVFCGKENNEINYKDVAKLKRYVSERGKILPRRITGNCAYPLEVAASSSEISSNLYF